MGHIEHYRGADIRVDNSARIAKSKVLLVDDDAATVEMIARILSAAGYEVVEFTQPALALTRAEGGEHFDLAVLDVVMPGIAGDSLAAQLRRLDPDLKILFVTGFDRVLFEARPVLWEGESYLDKPFTPRALLEAVSLALYGRIDS